MGCQEGLDILTNGMADFNLRFSLERDRCETLLHFLNYHDDATKRVS